MPKPRLSMEKIRELYRLKYTLNLSNRAIARALNITHPVVREYLSKLQSAGLEPAAVDQMDDDTLYSVIIGDRKQHSRRYQTLAARFEHLQTELKRTGVTLERLWREYLQEHPDGYGYSQFCHHFQLWRGTLDISMHIEHKAGDKMFADFTGKKFNIVDRHTGEITEAECFVALLAASQYTYVEAVASQRKHDWIRANENALHYFGGVPKAAVPDCLKSAVQTANKYEPEINPDYFDFARHYGMAILPARPNHPKDKALVEGAVKIVYQRIFAPLRNHTFHTLDELNQAIRLELEAYNARPMQRLARSRREFFERVEKDTLSPLPKERYTVRHFKRLKAHINYHIYLSEDRHYYSLPYRYRGKEVLLAYSDKVVEIFYNHIRIAWHYRDREPGGYTTVKDHMPSAHQVIADWNPQRLVNQASQVGEAVSRVVEQVLARKQHPEQGFKACQGIIRLADRFSKERLDQACKKAIELDYYSYRGIENMLKNNLEAQQPDLFDTLPDHGNLRGEGFYQQQ